MPKVRVHIKEMCEERGITQKQLSKLTGIRESSISELARNSKTVVNISHLEKIAEALGVADIAELISLE